MNKFLSSIVDSNRHTGSSASLMSRSQNHQPQQANRANNNSSGLAEWPDRSTTSPSSGSPQGIPRAAPATHLTAPVHIDVGGTIYTSTLQTLTKYSNSRLAQMFNGTLPIILDSLKQHYFIDRDGITFRHILNFLRLGRLMLPDGFEEVELLLMEAQYYQLDQLVVQIQRWRQTKISPPNRLAAANLHKPVVHPHRAPNVVVHQSSPKPNGFAPAGHLLVQAKRKRPNPPQTQLPTVSPQPASPAASTSNKGTPSPISSPQVKSEEIGDRVTLRVVHSNPEKVFISGHLTTVEEIFPESQNALFNLDLSDELVSDLDLVSCCPTFTSNSVLDRLLQHNFNTEDQKTTENPQYPDFVVTESVLTRN